MNNNNSNMKFEEVNGRMENLSECSLPHLTDNSCIKSLDEVSRLESRRINEVHDSMENLNECNLIK